ncbi:sigma-54 interaction domain-containing protein [Prosthecomicrobium sp. N25]|uniref:sigma-54 interaction domain-containing protein n=1 Tax=Prosthecomicrobium sp. N25 TaxID=3129254 RepID=UPI003076C69C
MTPTPAAIDQILGSHPGVEDVRRLVRKAAASPARCVLIYGETGTGKGLVAQAIHELSQRSAGPFVDINCAAIPTELVESELFGHERGAFTGAASKKVGLVEAAHGGTLFLDEIRELSPVLQAKLLTLIDRQSFRRIGSVQPITVDVRFVAATNRILFREVREGRFREDLYYRLQVVAINLPPLRERGGDILYLARHFLQQLSDRYGRDIRRMSPEVEDILVRYSWPGNVRELQHLLERIVALEETDRVEVAHIPARVMRDIAGEGLPLRRGGRMSFHDATHAFQADLLRAALDEAGGNQQRAAEALGLTRHALRHQILKLGLKIRP